MAAIAKFPLPKLDSPRIQKLGWNGSSKFYSVYDNALQAEEHATMCEPEEGKLVSVRVAGYLLLENFSQSHIFGDQPSEELVSWFTSPSKSPQSTLHDVIIDSGTVLRDKFIRVFRTVATGYSQPSSRPSRPSFDTLEDMIKNSMESAGKDYRTSQMKALARDGHRCIVTGIFNQASLEHCSELVELNNVRALGLRTAHIFNESTMQGIDPAVGEDSQDRLLNKIHAAAGALAIMESFGFSEFTKAFKGVGGVHEVWNLLTLEVNLHGLFDCLELWFEHTEKLHCYRGHDRNIDGAPTFVEFNAQHGKEAPPPDPLLLALHATCARVAHMSGAADQIERDMEEMTVLASDGSSAALLSNLISPYADIRGVR